MRYLTIVEYGTFLGINSNCLVIRHEGVIVKEISLSHLRTIAILKNGITLSSDLVQACAIRNIKIFFLDWRMQIYSAVIAQNQHATVALRKAQFKAIEDQEKSCFISKEITYTKVKNQRSVLLYFGKYIAQSDNGRYEIIHKSTDKLNEICQNIRTLTSTNNDWKFILLGYEGEAAKLYWKTLSNVRLLPDDFIAREGRNANSITNKALNYGYAILLSQIWSALDNAGLEVFGGFYHEDRSGKPSLVLDVMEEYRAWVVDRIVIKLREKLSKSNDFDTKIKKQISDNIRETLQKQHFYNNKNIKLENIIQRQVYRLSGYISCSKDKYKGYKFKW